MEIPNVNQLKYMEWCNKIDLATQNQFWAAKMKFAISAVILCINFQCNQYFILYALFLLINTL